MSHNVLSFSADTSINGFLSGPQLWSQLSLLASQSRPFFFVVDYARERGLIVEPTGANPFGVLYSLPNSNNLPDARPTHKELPTITAHPEPFDIYRSRFEAVQESFRNQETHLINLTLRTPIDLDCSLEDVFWNTDAKYKVWLPEHFVCFSPERFVHINEQGVISSHPMKGTIDASLPKAAQQILSNHKEQEEHAAMVRLISQELAQVGTDVSVPRYRYIDEIPTQAGSILQVSSQVTAQLPTSWQARLGDILSSLLPAGSIAGAPKPQSLDLITRVEQHNRGFYTGICGYFDGESLDTGVLIRFIEQDPNGLFFFHSGGGVTIESDCQKEYEEVIKKIYLPVR